MYVIPGVGVSRATETCLREIVHLEDECPEFEIDTLSEKKLRKILMIADPRTEDRVLGVIAPNPSNNIFVSSQLIYHNG